MLEIKTTALQSESDITALAQQVMYLAMMENPYDYGNDYEGRSEREILLGYEDMIKADRGRAFLVQQANELIADGDEAYEIREMAEGILHSLEKLKFVSSEKEN